MNTRTFTSAAIILVAAASLLFTTSDTALLQSTPFWMPRANSHPAPHYKSADTSPLKARIVDAYSKLPMAFEANQGQMDSQIKFFSRGKGYSVFLTPTEAVIALPGQRAPLQSDTGVIPNVAIPQVAHAKKTDRRNGAVLRMRLVGANARIQTTGLGELPGKTNYFINNDPEKWRTNVPTYSKVKYKSVYPSVDLVYYGNQQQLEYDFIIAPGGAPESLTLSFSGAEKLKIDENGNIVIQLSDDYLQIQRPLIYQEIGGNRKIIAGGYVLKDADQVAFQVGTFDRSKPLIIDPVLNYSTYLGGSGIDRAQNIAVDAMDNVYIVGTTDSTNFPTANSFQSTNNGTDTFIVKMNSTGSDLIYATYLGGGDFESGLDIAVDTSGNSYITGSTNSTDFPTVNPLQSTKNGIHEDAFVAKLNNSGSALLYSTYLGGTVNETAVGIAVDNEMNVYLTGETGSPDFPTVNPTQSTKAGSLDAFVVRINPSGSSLAFSTFLGGSDFDRAMDIAIDTSGNVYVVGLTQSMNFPTVAPLQSTLLGFQDAFVTKVNASNSSIIYSTYLGGNGSDEGRAIALGALDTAIITGTTNSSNFPTVNPIQSTRGGLDDAFVSRLNASGSALTYSTYLGGTNDETSNGVKLDPSGNIYVIGHTNSPDFPLVSPIQSYLSGGSIDVFVTKLNVNGSALIYSSYLGGLDMDIGQSLAIDSLDSVYLVGWTKSTDFPTSNSLQAVFAGGSFDAFVTKIAENRSPVAMCHDVTVSAAATCASGASIDNGSFDPDGDPITIIQSPQSPYPTGNTLVTLTVTDSRGASSECTAMVTVVDDTPPSLGSYPTTAVTAGGNSTITPNAAPSDNCSVISATAAAAGEFQSPFTGVLTVNPSTGVVTVTDAKPTGTYTITVTATDNSGMSSTSSFTLIVNNPANCAGGGFGFTPATGSPVGVGSHPYSVAAGDFNADGKQDIVTANISSNSVTILLGDGSGGFTLANGSPVVVGASPIFVTVGDFNGDAKQDLAVANNDSDNVTILLGNGSGGFNQAIGSPVDVGGRDSSLIVGDFDGNGRQDLAVARSGAVSILLGNGTGAFSQALNSPIPVGTFPYSVVVGDFNSDAKQDLAVADSNSSNLTILLGNGNGEFNPTQSSPIVVGNQPLSIGVGDFNSDGKQDLATANSNSHTVTILLGDGSGGFIQPAGSPVAVGTTPYSLELGDFNGDSKQDIAVANFNSANVTILLGNGIGGFSPAFGSPFGLGGNPRSVAVGDFNGDGKQDLGTANYFSNNVTILLNTCTPNTPPTISTVGVTRQEGNSSANSVVATVNDTEDAENLLTVTANGNASATVNGVTVSTLSVDNGGVVTADVIAACGASNASFVLTVTDSGSLTTNATLNVTVMANSPPVLGTYPSAGTINLGAGTSVIPSATPSDNVTISHISASAPGFTGDFSVDQTTGVVTISNAGPAGVYAVTVSADDNCNATSNVTFPLEVNATPSINGTTISRQQGSPASNSQIATITDADQSVTTLMVSANQATGSGVVLSNITINVEGKVFADVVASCNAVNSTFTLMVTDNHGAIATATLTIIVTANNAPTMGTYQTVTVNPGTNTNVTPNTIPMDNGSVTLLTASASGFTGTLSGNASTGVITISNAAPNGTYTVTVTATDNCGAISTTTFTLIVNTPPAITGVTISRQRGSSASVSQIATVSDVNQAANTLAVAVNGGTSASVNGVTVNSVSVDALGSVTASVVASCAATNASFTLSVIDSLGMTTTATLIVNVLANTSPFLGNYPSAGVLNLGAGTTVTPDAVPGDNGSITSLIASAPGFSGSLSVNPTNGAVTIVNASPKGNYTVTVIATDNCGATVNRSFTLKVNANR